VLDLLSEGKEKLVIDAWKRSPLSGTGAEHPEKTMVSSNSSSPEYLTTPSPPPVIASP
jgi:hypothetical protein